MSEVELPEERFTALFRRHYDSVLRYALRRTEPEAAAEAAAEVFVVTWRRLSEVPAESLPWLIATARHVLANQRRSRRRADRLRYRLEAQPGPASVGVDDVSELNRRWAAALASLSAADQEVLALVAWDGLTAKEAAASLGCSVSAFTTRLHRARRRLAVLLGRTHHQSAGPAERDSGAEITTSEVAP